MAKVPFVDGLGPGDCRPTLDVKRASAVGLSAEEGFVVSRIDGKTALAEIFQLVPFARDETLMILRRLWLAGVVELPGVARPSPAKAKPVEPATPAAAAKSGVPSAVIENEKSGALSDSQRQRIDSVYSRLDQLNAFELLEIARGADDKDVKRAYFRLSKEFHPDRFYMRDMGEYRMRVTKIFHALKQAFEVLSDEERRAAYEESAGLK